MHGHGGTQKRGKKSNKWVSKVCFATRVHNAKKQEVRRDGHGGQRGLIRAMAVRERVCGGESIQVLKVRRTT